MELRLFFKILIKGLQKDWVRNDYRIIGNEHPVFLVEFHSQLNPTLNTLQTGTEKGRIKASGIFRVNHIAAKGISEHVDTILIGL